MTYPSCLYLPQVFFFATPDGGPIHAAVKATGAPWARVGTLCGLPLDGLQKGASWAVWREKAPGVPANPFYSGRGCGVCWGRLSV